MPQSSGNNRNTSKVVLQGASDNSVAMEGGPMLFKMMDVLALVFTTGSSALSASAFARGGGLGGGLLPVSSGPPERDPERAQRGIKFELADGDWVTSSLRKNS